MEKIESPLGLGCNEGLGADHLRQAAGVDETKDLLLRMEAAADGKNKFFHGRPCSFGHVSERYVLSGTCVACQKVTNDVRRNKLRAAGLCEKRKVPSA